MTKISKFVISCKQCEKQNVEHKTELFIDWEREIYAIRCKNCGEEEVFDGQAAKVKSSGIVLPKLKLTN